MNNLDDMDTFLKHTLLLPRLNHEKVENLNRTITGAEIKTVIKKLPQNESSVLNSFTGEFYQTLKADLMPVLFKLSHETEEVEHFLTHFLRPKSP